MGQLRPHSAESNEKQNLLADQFSYSSGLRAGTAVSLNGQAEQGYAAGAVFAVFEVDDPSMIFGDLSA